MIKYITFEEVLQMHDAFIAEFGGLAGLRDPNLLDSAVEVPKATMFGQDLYPSLYDKAAAYLYHIVRNHPFYDGNKRTGFGAAYLFLKANRVSIAFSDESFENLVVEVAKGTRTKAQIAYFFEHGKEPDNM